MVENFRAFRGLASYRKSFPANFLQLSFVNVKSLSVFIKFAISYLSSKMK